MRNDISGFFTVTLLAESTVGKAEIPKFDEGT
jgi:hypothetical protein